MKVLIENPVFDSQKNIISGDVVDWPMTLGKMKKYDRNTAFDPKNMSWANYPLIIDAVETLKPVGDVVKQISPDFIDGILTQQWAVAAYSVNHVQSFQIEKKQIIKKEFIASFTPIDFPLDNTSWNPGIDSALALDGVIRIAEYAGVPSVKIHDIDNRPHNYSIADAKSLVVLIAVDYQTRHAAMQARKVALSNVDLTRAEAAREIKSV